MKDVSPRARTVRTITEDLLFQIPGEIEEGLKRIRERTAHPDNEPGITPVEFFLRHWKLTAENILARAGLPTDLPDLSGANITLNSGGTSPKLDATTASAKDVLLRVDRVRDALANNDAEKTALEMMILTASALRMEIVRDLMAKLASDTGPAKIGEQPKRMKGAESYIRDQLNKNTWRTPKQMWVDLRRYNVSRPLVIDEHELYMKPETEDEGELLIQVDRRGQKAFLTFRGFKEYVTRLKEQIEFSRNLVAKRAADRAASKVEEQYEGMRGVESFIQDHLGRNKRKTAKQMWFGLRTYDAARPLVIGEHELYVEPETKDEHELLVQMDRERKKAFLTFRAFKEDVARLKRGHVRTEIKKEEKPYPTG